jgi:hypothetical protein
MDLVEVWFPLTRRAASASTTGTTDAIRPCGPTVEDILKKANRKQI